MVDAAMLERVLTHIHNFFDHGSFYLSDCTIEGGRLPRSVTLPEGVWYRIEGSLLNDGLHRHVAPDLNDETFAGTVTVCAVPNALLDIVEEIQEWVDANAEARAKAASTPYQSESFDGYSYNLRGDLSGSTGHELTGWQSAFATELNAWRKMSL